MSGQRNWRVRNHEVGPVAGTRLCVYGKGQQERRLRVSRANSTEWERKAKSWVQSREADSQAPRNQEAATMFSCREQKLKKVIPSEEGLIQRTSQDLRRPTQALRATSQDGRSYSFLSFSAWTLATVSLCVCLCRVLLLS